MRKLVRGIVGLLRGIGAFLRMLARPFRGSRIDYPESDELKLERERMRGMRGF